MFFLVHHSSLLYNRKAKRKKHKGQKEAYEPVWQTKHSDKEKNQKQKLPHSKLQLSLKWARIKQGIFNLGVLIQIMPIPTLSKSVHPSGIQFPQMQSKGIGLNYLKGPFISKILFPKWQEGEIVILILFASMCAF